MVRALVYVIPVALAIYAIIDLSRSESSERMGISPFALVPVIVLLPVLGPLIWILLTRLPRESGAGPTGTQLGRVQPMRRAGPRAPDDDTDFLWRLDQQRRKERGTDSAPPDDGPPRT